LGLAAKVGEPGADGLDGRAACGQIVWLALQFAQANPGMVRVLVGDALVFEQARLTERVALLFEKLEAVLRAHWRHWASQQDLATPTADAQVRAALLLIYLRGVLHAFVRSDWKQLPTQGADAHLETLLG
jgi:TetR/AcrR family transcriptional regulator